jgi:hypothetical protein
MLPSGLPIDSQIQGLGTAVDQLLEGLRVAVVGEAHLDAVLRQGVGEQVVGAAVERAGRDDVVAGLGDGLDGVGDGRLARGQRQSGDAAFHGGDALLQHVLGRVHDAGVDVARHLEVEQVGAMLGAVEGVGGGLVDGHRHRLGGGLGRVAAVYGKGLDLHGPGGGWVNESRQYSRGVAGAYQVSLIPAAWRSRAAIASSKATSSTRSSRGFAARAARDSVTAMRAAAAGG